VECDTSWGMTVVPLSCLTVKLKTLKSLEVPGITTVSQVLASQFFPDTVDLCLVLALTEDYWNTLVAPAFRSWPSDWFSRLRIFS
jgi:hypothetical protein